MTQDDVIEIMLTARTRAEIVRAREVMMDWMREHPSDFKVASGGERLVMLAQAKGMEDPHKYTPPMVIVNCWTGKVIELTTEEEMREYLDSQEEYTPPIDNDDDTFVPYPDEWYEI